MKWALRTCYSSITDERDDMTGLRLMFDVVEDRRTAERPKLDDLLVDTNPPFMTRACFIQEMTSFQDLQSPSSSSPCSSPERAKQAAFIASQHSHTLGAHVAEKRRG